MKRVQVYVSGIGIISPLGNDTEATVKALRANSSSLSELDLFKLLADTPPLPTGQVRTDIDVNHNHSNENELPRTHLLALKAAEQAMRGHSEPPGAIVIGTTTGGILTTEQLLRDKQADQAKSKYRHHGLNTVGEELGRYLNCNGKILTVSTACSSGAVAISIAMELLRQQRAKTVLVGGVDSLCRLTYFGFQSLQLIDKDGCRPLDVNRRGMSVAEGAGMLLLTTDSQNAIAELAGAGLSCDAHHPAAPHPEGKGAAVAMKRALSDAGIEPRQIDYINLHGTGTPENDLAEAKAVHSLFSPFSPPPLSSIKGASGHSLAAAGAIEAVIAALCINNDFIPGNTGLRTVDPALRLNPLINTINKPLTTIISNSFGFGGNNGSLVVKKPENHSLPVTSRDKMPEKTETKAKAKKNLAILGLSCTSGAGGTEDTLKSLNDGKYSGGLTDMKTISKKLLPALIRRLKKIPRMSLYLTVNAHAGSGMKEKPSSIFMGTSWGALSETYDFLDRLTTSKEQFPSPTDFIGSVHNGAAGQVAILMGAKGANITNSGGDYSFEQSLISAELLLSEQDNNSAILMGADEYHEVLSPLLDSSINENTRKSDGGGALHICRSRDSSQVCIRLSFYRFDDGRQWTDELLESLKKTSPELTDYKIIMVGIPAGIKEKGEQQLSEFMAHTSFANAIICPYRQYTGEYGSASAMAAVWAASILQRRDVPEFMHNNSLNSPPEIDGKSKIIILGLGTSITAMELYFS